MKVHLSVLTASDGKNSNGEKSTRVFKRKTAFEPDCEWKIMRQRPSVTFRTECSGGLPVIIVTVGFVRLKGMS
jgi:hypothetical protein